MALPGPIAAAARRCRPPIRKGRRLPAVWLFSDPVRLPDPCAAARALPRGAGVVARGAAPGVLARLAGLGRQRRLVLLVAADGRGAVALGAGLHLPERRAAAGLLPFLIARRAGRRWAVLTMAAHGGPRAAARVRQLRPDLVFLSPVFRTASHPGAPALGPLRWAAAARRLAVPAAALGGVSGTTARRLPRVAGLAAIGGLAQQKVVALPPQCLR